MSDAAEITSPLVQKFQAFYEQFTDFTHDAVELHNRLPVHDDASRAAFNSLSRVLAFVDQLNLLVSLMGDDVRLVGELTTNPVAATWTEEIDRSFYEWLKSSRNASPNVN